MLRALLRSDKLVPAGGTLSVSSLYHRHDEYPNWAEVWPKSSQ